jgi:hypothetical protein
MLPAHLILLIIMVICGATQTLVCADKWDKNFIEYEQGPKAFKVYSDYEGKSALNRLNNLSRKEGWFFAAGLFSKHTFPDFAAFDNYDGKNKATINTANTQFGTFIRTNIPLFMLYPSTHQTMSGFKLNDDQKKEVWGAYNGINKFYESSKIK